MEVIVLAFVEVGQVPVNANIFEAQIVPLIGVWVVWYGVVVNVLAWHETSSEFDKFAGVQLSWAAAPLLVPGGDPAALHDQSCSVDADRVS